jgi:ABC-2 type transport system ATP-binding protein
MKIANGLLTPTSGNVIIDGKTPSPSTKKIVSYLPERTYIPDSMSVRQLLNFFSDFYTDFSRETALTMMNSLGIQETQEIKQMSKGTREKVQLIMVMSRKALLFLLDEPIGGVDPATRDYIIRTIIGNYNKEASIIISTHLISEVENILDDVLFLNQGKIVLNASVESIREDSGKSVDQMFREVFRC